MKLLPYSLSKIITLLFLEIFMEFKNKFQAIVELWRKDTSVSLHLINFATLL